MNIFRRLTPYFGGLAILWGTMLYGTTGFMSANASDVVAMTCGYRGHGLEVTEYDDSGNPNASDLVKGTSCVETVKELVEGNYSIDSGVTGQTGVAAFTVLGVAPVLDPGDLQTLTNNDGKGCSCDDSVPIPGFTCNFCTIKISPGGTVGSGVCICNFTSSTPLNP